MILYKYRSFDNYEFLLDILINERLYCSIYKNLNDPFGLPPKPRTHLIGMILLSEVLNATTSIYRRIQARGSEARPPSG
ncbi:MAG: hypothetical protein WCD07_07625, partial [Burkholderiales bacterium]